MTEGSAKMLSPFPSNRVFCSLSLGGAVSFVYICTLRHHQSPPLISSKTRRDLRGSEKAQVEHSFAHFYLWQVRNI